MANLTADRDTPLKGRDINADPVAATQSIYTGAMVMLDASGNLVRAGATATLVMRGIARQQSLSAAAGTIVESQRNTCARMNNSSAGDAITRAEIGDTAYVVDDNTVAKTDGSGARPAAGKIVDVDSVGVWVEFA